MALCVASAAAAERHVPGEYATLQAAIDACLAGDEVIIADGTYTGVGNTSLELHGLAITVRSASGDPATCVIDCEGSGRGFYFHNSEGADSIVQGLTIRSGNVTNGNGGGVYCYSSSPMLISCAVTGNTARTGGGVCVYDASPTLTDCTIQGNLARGYGGAVVCSSSSNPTLTDCAIASNMASINGGGVFCHFSSPTLVRCSITSNTCSSNGGGVYCDRSSPTLTGCTIAGNITISCGGGVFFDDYSMPMLTNCTIAGNTAIGGGVWCDYYSGPTLINCTITSNEAGSGGGMFCYYASSPTLTNCILWADTPQEISVDTGVNTLLTHCNAQGGWSGDGNINADPLFRDPDGPDDDPNTVGDNDYRLAFDSPCLDVGDNSVVPAGSLDLDGHPRIARFVVDMGAYEIPFGDLDCSGTIDFGDINPFVLVLSNPPAYAQMYPDCPPPHGDLDANGEVGFGDINPFVALLTGGK